jgi:hypothetical protein
VKELRSRSKKSWLVDSGIVLLYSFFLTTCFFIGFAHVYLNDMRTWSLISGILVILVSPCISYLLNDLGRTIAIYFLSSLLGVALESITSVILFFHSFESYGYLERKNGIIEEVLVSPAQLILLYTICVLFVCVLGAIAGNYIAERRHRGEKVFSMRCSSCGTYNERDALKCSFCGKELTEERYAAEARTRTP